MNTFLFYLAAAALCGVSTILIRNATTPSLASATTSMESKIRLRIAGRVLIAFAAVSAGMGVFAQVVSSHH